MSSDPRNERLRPAVAWAEDFRAPWVSRLLGDHAMEGITTEQLVQLLPIAPATARRYKRDGAPAWARELVAIKAGGELGRLAPAWSGWRLAAGELVSPEGDRFRPGQIQAIPVQAQRLAELDRLARGPVQFLLDV